MTMACYLTFSNCDKKDETMLLLYNEDLYFYLLEIIYFYLATSLAAVIVDTYYVSTTQ